MTRLSLLLPLFIAGCVVVTSSTYKPIATEGVVRSERCSAHYSYRTQIDEGITLTIDTAHGDYNFMFVSIGIKVSKANSLRFLDAKLKLVSGDNGSVEYGDVKFFPSFQSRSTPMQHTVLTGIGSTDEEKQVASSLGYMPFVANVNFGKFFPKRFTMYLPNMQTSKSVIAVPPITFEMQAEKSVTGVLCGL